MNLKKETGMKKAAMTLIAFATLFGATTAFGATTKRWIIMYNGNSIPGDAAARVASAGGTIVAQLPEIAAIAASSSNDGFAASMAAAGGVSDVVEDVALRMIPTAAEMRLQRFDATAAAGTGPAEPPGMDTQTGPEPFYAFQWDKKRMRASTQGSYSVQLGRPDVVVAVLDSGADILPFPHQDVAVGLDFARSRSFFPVTPDPNGDPTPAAWDDKNGHGSWCQSAVGARINGIGISGVAPNVTRVALKVLGDDGTGSFVALGQALIYCGVQKFDVASMSLGAYLPRSNQDAHALLKFVQRAVNFARANGVTPIAALGNDSLDVSDGNTFQSYLEVPGEVDGVIGVSATGYFNMKASYSNYGMGKTDVSAPGGDFAVQTTSQTNPLGGGSVLGAWATEVFGPNSYAFASGTSMACPNAAGVVALIISQYGDFTPDNSRKAHMSPQAVEAILQRTANNQPCPEPRTVNYFLVFPLAQEPPLPPLPAGSQIESPDQRCQGSAGYNNFFGKGIVDAFKAVTEK